MAWSTCNVGTSGAFSAGIGTGLSFAAGDTLVFADERLHSDPPTTVGESSGHAEAKLAMAAESGDASALAARLRELLALPQRAELGLAARRAVERNWSWTRVAERLLEPLAPG